MRATPCTNKNKQLNKCSKFIFIKERNLLNIEKKNKESPRGSKPTHCLPVFLNKEETEKVKFIKTEVKYSLNLTNIKKTSLQIQTQ